LYVEVTITVEHQNVWTLPVSAVVTKEDESFCYRPESGVAIRTLLQLGLRGADRVEILKKQLKPAQPGEQKPWENITGEEEIIRSDAAGLKDGQTVEVTSGEQNR
jgi:hypothetical protein